MSMQIPVQCTSIIFGIRHDLTQPGVSCTLIDQDYKTYSLVFIEADAVRDVFTAFAVSKLHTARGKWVFLELDDTGKALGISGYDYSTIIAYCDPELSVTR
jgi:hypothetical protein